MLLGFRELFGKAGLARGGAAHFRSLGEANVED